MINIGDVYYHVADPSYADGGDLWCRDELELQGIAPAWKWSPAPEGFDGDVVCLFRDFDKAAEFLAEYVPDGRILRVLITEADELRLTHVDEGYPAVFRRIPAHCIIGETQQP